MQTLKEMPIWVVWKYETINGKRTKVLYSAKTKNKCGTNEKYQAQWVLYEEASTVTANANFDGVGFVIPKGYAVLDMDHLEDENVPQQIGALIPPIWKCLQAEKEGISCLKWMLLLSYGGW